MKGLVRIASAVPRVHIGNVAANIEEHIKLLQMAKDRHASLAVFPELSLTGYTCADLFFQQTLQEDVEAGIDALCEKCPAGMAVVVGAPVKIGGSLYNCAVVIAEGKCAALSRRPISRTPTSSMRNAGLRAEETLSPMRRADTRRLLEACVL